MIDFNPLPAEDISVESDDGVRVHFAENTLGYNYTADGISITPDWTSRRFTLAFPKDSVLYHVTQEGVEEKRGNEGNVTTSEFIADVYTGVRAIGDLIPKDYLEIEYLGVIELEEIREYLREEDVLTREKGHLTVNGERRAKLEDRLRTDPMALFEFYTRALDFYPKEDAFGTGEHFFAVPGLNELFLVFRFPDDYVAVIEIRDLLDVTETLTGSRVFDMLLQTISEGTLK